MSISEYIIYENKDVIAVNKPEGYLVIPGGYPTKEQNLRDQLREIYSEIFVVHRIDKLTSGLVIFAKNKKTHKKLCFLFENRKTRKIYYACLFGSPLWQKKSIQFPLSINGDRRHRTIIDLKKGKFSQTNIEIVENLGYFAKAKISPKTGYTHQIRAHLSAIGHPIIGDPLYCHLRKKNSEGKIEVPFCERGMYLHAASLEFIDNDINLPKITAKIPEKFSKIQNTF